MSAPRVRALEASDADSARAVVRTQLCDTPYCARVLEQLDIALSGEDPEYAGLVATHGAAGEAALGMLLSGPVSGARGVVKVHALVGADADTLGVLLDAVLAAHAREGGTVPMTVCEIADDLTHACAASALAGRGFAREGRVADYFRDGIALDILVRRS